MSIKIEGNKSAINSLYRPEIDGLRAFAVVAVIVYHFNKDILPNGYLGVDIFFVISGFVITSSLYQKQSKTFKDFISVFYQRRIRRLLPALSVYVLIMSIAICLFNPEPNLSLRTGISSLFGLSNIYLLRQTTDYFAQSTNMNVFTNTWSLGVETQFYLIFPFIMWFSGIGRQKKNGLRNLFLIIGVLTFSSLITFLYLYEADQSKAYFLMQTRFWEIATGCLTFIGFHERKSIKESLEILSPLLVLGLIIGLMYLPISQETLSTLAVVGLSVVLIGSLKRETIVFTLFTNPKVVYVGLISYSLYLWHWGVLSISRWTIGIHLWSTPLQIVLILGLAIMSYEWIERPLRKFDLFENIWKTLIICGGVIFTLTGGLIALEKPLKGKLFSGRELTWQKKWPLSQGNECLDSISKNTYCYFKNNQSNQTLWAIGDSHTGMLHKALEKVAEDTSMNLKLYMAGGTPFPPLDRYHKKNKQRDLQLIDDFRLLEKEFHKQIKFDDIILLSMRLPYHFGGTYFQFKPSDFNYIKSDGSFGSQENYFNDWILSVKNLANISQKFGAKLILLTPTPEWEREHLAALCSLSNKQWFNSLQKRNCKIKSDFFTNRNTGLYKNLFQKLNKLSNNHPNIFLFDIYKTVCPSNECDFSRNGIDIYQDSTHIAPLWAKKVIAPKIVEFIKRIEN